MKNTMVTIYVRPEDLHTVLTHLNILEGLDIENNYTFRAKDIKWCEMPRLSEYVTLNIPAAEYIKFKYKYNQML